MQSIKSTALEPTPVELEGLSTGQKIGRLLPVYGLPLCTLLLIVIFSIALPNTFPTMLNLRSILGDKAIIAILSLAAMIPMMAGRIDLTVGYGIVLWLVGLLVSFVAPVMHVNRGEWTVDEAATFLPIPLGDMVLFGAFFAAAIWYRDKMEIHKRLMVMATIAVVFAAAFRLQNAGVPMQWAIVVWYVPLVLAIAYDLFTRGRVHPVYLIGAGVMAVALLRLPFALGSTEFWLERSRPIIQSLAG